MVGPWVHDIDPIIGTVVGVHLWWYGLSYSLGFLNAHVFFVRHRAELGLSMREVYELSLLISIGVLIGGRCSSCTTSARSTRITSASFRPSGSEAWPLTGSFSAASPAS